MDIVRNVTQFIYRNRYRISYIILAILAVAAFSFRLPSLTPGPSTQELGYLFQAQALTYSNIFSCIVNLPHLLLTALVDFIFSTNMVGLRLSSVFFASTMIPMLYLTLKTWHSRRIAIIGMLLLIGSGWFIGLARLGDSTIMYSWAVMAAITASTIIFHHVRWGRNRELLLMVAGILISLSLYVPYAIYIYLLGILIVGKRLKILYKELRPRKLLTVAVPALILIIPLIGGLIVHPSQALELMGVPSSVPNINTVLIAMKDIFSDIFWRSNDGSMLALGTLPHLGIFGASMVALGLIHYEQHRQNFRTHLIIGSFFGLFLILAFDYKLETSSALLPLVYILVAMGVITLLVQWYKIFPKNPFAKRIGLIIAALLVLISLFYENERYFRAWANAPRTKTLFSDDVLKIDSYITDSAAKRVWLIASDQPALRFQTWFYHNQDQVRVSSKSLEATAMAELSASYDTVIIQSELAKPDNFTDYYQLDEAILTTSLQNPVMYEVFTPIGKIAQ